MPNEMQEARTWLEQEVQRPEVTYLLEMLKAHQDLLSRHMALGEEFRRDRGALRESSRQLAEVQGELETKNEELADLMKHYRVEKNAVDDYGKKLAHALNMLTRVRAFCQEMERFGMEQVPD